MADADGATDYLEIGNILDKVKQMTSDNNAPN
eukprot:CAMPEP_0116875438 /NCGR_PEP_ID=MMETSP0463-20121206/7401_1 /TAXON_ID=181622 /ORGANISM="Strombidinopsis sp, Strain SopsisLIS2011" /LENGTH=31 /DNA_ID= /DNA_START= /DNA_END= /DNA_ORIENTATION=